MLIAQTPTVAFELKGGDEASAEARRALIAGNGELPANVREDVLLLLTELVTNAVRHSGIRPDESVHVELHESSQRVRVRVVDTGTPFTRIRPSAREDQTGGWGLLLVDRIADTWGVGPTATGTCVWFEIEFDR
jgi:anti-sigma regulatory factor (Ser/Thr protein kinase)